jgi:hypothetical protein
LPTANRYRNTSNGEKSIEAKNTPAVLRRLLSAIATFTTDQINQPMTINIFYPLRYGRTEDIQLSRKTPVSSLTLCLQKKGKEKSARRRSD